MIPTFAANPRFAGPFRLGPDLRPDSPLKARVRLVAVPHGPAILPDVSPKRATFIYKKFEQFVESTLRLNCRGRGFDLRPSGNPSPRAWSRADNSPRTSAKIPGPTPALFANPCFLAHLMAVILVARRSAPGQDRKSGAFPYLVRYAGSSGH